MPKALPSINVLPIHEIILPVSKQSYKFVPYTIDQERNILTAVESKDIKAMLDNYKKLIAECSETCPDWNTLSAMEFILIAVNLRAKSKGEVMDISTKCKECDGVIELAVNIEDQIVAENDGVISDICKYDDQLSFEIGPVRMDFLYQVNDLKSQTDLMLETAVHSISKVFWEDDIYTDFTPESLKEQITFTYPMLKKIFESTSKLIRLLMKVDIVCPKPDCGHKEEYIIRDFLKYLI